MLASNTTNLHVCSQGHDWQAVRWIEGTASVLVVCRRCADSRWVGNAPVTASDASPICACDCGCKVLSRERCAWCRDDQHVAGRT